MSATELEFKSDTIFGALYAAQQWCRDNGISCGSTDITGSVCLMRGDILIAKWKNLTAKERAQCDGVMSGNWREGPVYIRMKDQT